MRTIYRRIQKLEARAQRSVSINARRLLAERLEAMHQRHAAFLKRGEALPVVELADIQARLKVLFEEPGTARIPQARATDNVN